jgi:hypothetical protein
MKSLRQPEEPGLSSHKDHFYKTFTNPLRAPDKRFTNRGYIEGNMKTDPNMGSNKKLKRKEINP